MPIYNRVLSVTSRSVRDYSSALAVKFRQPEGHSEFKDPEWDTAKPMSEIPALSKFMVITRFLPGGKYHNIDLTKMQQCLFEEFGSLVKFPGLFGRRDLVFAYDPKDFQKIYRTEGPWPVRRGMDSFVHYREKIRPDVFKNMGGLLTEHGKSWQEVRSVVNPVMMQPRNVLKYVEVIDEVANDFISILKSRVLANNAPEDLFQELNKWALESIGYVALDTRLDVLGDGGKDLIRAVQDFFVLTYELDILPSMWQYVSTPKYRKLMKTLDDLTNILTGHINKALKRLETNQKSPDHELSVLEKLLKIDPHIAFVMALDMLMAGVDTTSSATSALLYHLARYPEKQNKLRAEIRSVLPEINAPVTQDALKNMPYLRACMKESHRMFAVAVGNARTTTAEIVLNGYRIEKNTDVVLSHDCVQKMETNFQKPSEFIPERWLKDPVAAGCPLAKTADPFVYMPFGFGPRSCIGKRFAELEMSVLVVKMVRQFELGWRNKDLTSKSRLINVPGIPIKFDYNILSD